MNSRYLTNIALLILASFLVVASQVWAPPTFMWLMFGGAILAVLSAGAMAIPGRGLIQRVLDGSILILGAWSIIASLVFAGSTVTWLGFGFAVVLFGLTVIGLTLHELRTERVVHSLELTGRERAEVNGRERDLIAH